MTSHKPLCKFHIFGVLTTTESKEQIWPVKYILAHRIRISELLPWVIKSYFTQAILPRLSREGYIHWL